MEETKNKIIELIKNTNDEEQIMYIYVFLSELLKEDH